MGAHIGDGTCVAPTYFKRVGCRLAQSFRGWTWAMKRAYTEQCRVAWPCASDSQALVRTVNGPLPSQAVSSNDSCELDLSSCPRLWMQRVDGFCEPAPNSTGKCGSAQRFDDMSYEEKVRWASDCFVLWPCLGEFASLPTRQSRAAYHVDVPFGGPLTANGFILPS